VLSDNVVLVQQLLPPDAEAGGGAAQGRRRHEELTNDEKHELIGEALYYGFIGIVKYLGDQPWFEPNHVYREFHSKFDVTPLFIAMNQACVALLVERGADPDATDRNGKTPLFYDYKRSFTANMITELINAGVDVNHTDIRGHTALASHIQEERTTNSVIQAFLKGGADPLLSEGAAMSAMQLAEIFRRDLVGLLRRHTQGKYHGANRNTVDSSGASVLSTAIDYAQEDAVSILLDHGADPTLGNDT
jgi:ankyrin repeat protein